MDEKKIAYEIQAWIEAFATDIGHYWHIGQKPLKDASKKAARAIAEWMREDVVWEKSGIVYADQGFHEDEYQSYAYIAYEVHTNDDRHLNTLLLGTDYHDQALDVRDGQRVQVTVTREDAKAD